MKNSDLVLIGQITGTFGIKGELKIFSESDFIEYRFRKGAKIVLSDKTEHIVSSSRFHKGNVLITIDELYNINLVLDKVGLKVYAYKNDNPPLNDDEYYIDSLVGLEVYNTNNEHLGKITDIIEIPSGFILEIIDENDKRFLLPFVDEFVKEITNEKIIIKEIEGIR